MQWEERGVFAVKDLIVQYIQEKEGNLNMGVRVMWDEQQENIIHYNFDALWTWDDVYIAFDEAHSMIEERAKPLGVILSGPDNMLVPPNMLTHTRKLMGSKKSKHTKLIVFVTNNMFIRTMANILTKIISTELHTAYDMESAKSLVVSRLQASIDKD
jgi:hypothetical protein